MPTALSRKSSPLLSGRSDSEADIRVIKVIFGLYEIISRDVSNVFI